MFPHARRRLGFGLVIGHRSQAQNRDSRKQFSENEKIDRLRCIDRGRFRQLELVVDSFKVPAILSERRFPTWKTGPQKRLVRDKEVGGRPGWSGNVIHRDRKGNCRVAQDPCARRSGRWCGVILRTPTPRR